MMSIPWKKIQDAIVHAKVYSQRSLSYLSIINGAMILFLALSKLQEYGFNINIQKCFFPLMFGGLIMLVIIGKLEDYLGFFRKESKATFDRFPQINTLIEQNKILIQDNKNMKKEIQSLREEIKNKNRKL